MKRVNAGRSLFNGPRRVRRSVFRTGADVSGSIMTHLFDLWLSSGRLVNVFTKTLPRHLQ